jgi:hypothetical protein
MNTFEQYLQLHEIDPIRLSMEAEVRYLTVHNAKVGNPITAENAKKLKEAVRRLTGVAYDGSFVLLPAKPADQLPVIPVRKLPSHMKQATVPTPLTFRLKLYGRQLDNVMLTYRYLCGRWDEMERQGSPSLQRTAKKE